MSRIGKKSIPVPASVQVTIQNQSVVISGPKGSLEYRHTPELRVAMEDQQLVIRVAQKGKIAAERYGLTRTLLANMVQGVSEGFVRKLEVNGVGFRAQIAGNSVQLALGFSHPVTYQLPEGVTAAVEGNTISLSGFDKQKVGQVAADIRALRKPEPYQGKGIKYAEEHIRRKAGKTTSK